MYPLVNKLVDPENSQFLIETNLPTLSGRVYVNLLKANCLGTRIVLFLQPCMRRHVQHRACMLNEVRG